MGFLKRLFGREPSPAPPWPPPGPITSWPVGVTDLTVAASATIFDRVSHTVDVVGEAANEAALDTLAGARTAEGPRDRDHLAILLPDPENPYDPNAVRVFLLNQATGHAAKVGHLSRENAVAYRSVIDRVAADGKLTACHATLIGGWDRGGGDRGNIGVLLYLDTPVRLYGELGLDAPEGTVATTRGGSSTRWQSPPAGPPVIDAAIESLTVRDDHPYRGWVVAFTGDSRCTIAGVQLDRPSSEAIARKAGIEVHPRVTKKVQRLIDCDDDSQSGNERKAIAYGVPVIPESEFWSALGVQVSRR